MDARRNSSQRFGKREWDGMDCRAEKAIREVKDFQKDPFDV